MQNKDKERDKKRRKPTEKKRGQDKLITEWLEVEMAKNGYFTKTASAEEEYFYIDCGVSYDVDTSCKDCLQ